MKILAPLILWTVLLLEVWNQGVARQPLFSAATWRGLVGRVVRHLCIQAIGQCQLDVTGSNRSVSAVKAWGRRQWSHLNTAAFRRTTLSLEPRWARPLQMALDALYQSTELELSNTDDLNIQQTGSMQDPSMSQMRLAARTMLRRRFPNELGLRSWPHQALLNALEKTMSGLSYRRYQYATLRLLSESGRGQWWQSMAQARRPLKGIPSP